MSEIKLVNILLSSLLMVTFVMFSWTFSFVNRVQTTNSINNATVVSAFNA